MDAALEAYNKAKGHRDLALAVGRKGEAQEFQAEMNVLLEVFPQLPALSASQIEETQRLRAKYREV